MMNAMPGRAAVALLICSLLGCQTPHASNLPVKGRRPAPATAPAESEESAQERAALCRRMAQLPRLLREARIVHGVTPNDDGALLGVFIDPDNQHKALFGGTVGGASPDSTLSEIYLFDKWVYVHGKFGEASKTGMMRWPIVITQTISIGADGTTFIVNRTDSTLASPQAVYCLEGKVTVYDRISGKPPVIVEEGKFVTTTCTVNASGLTTLTISQPAAIPPDMTNPHRAFVESVKTLAAKFQADVLY